MPGSLLSFNGDVGGLVALMALLLVPGLLLARAPLLCVPALSASFWIVSAWWLPATVGRERFLRALIVSFGVLALVRLRDVRGWRPSVSALAVGVGAVLPLALFFGPAVPGLSGGSFDSQSAALVVWNDGVPVSFQPLLDLQPFGAHAPAVATLSADVALLSGRPPSRSVFLVGLAAQALLVLGLFGLGVRRLAPPAAASLTVLASVVAFLPRVVAPLGGATAMLAFALAAAAALILEGGDSRARAAAAGFVLSGALLADAVVGLAAAVFFVARLRPWSSVTGRSRAALVVGLSLALAAPQLQRLGRTLSTRELVQLLGDSWRPAGRPCPQLPRIYLEEAAGTARPCALTSFDKPLRNPDLPDAY
jgi:hypothetical protein